MVRHYYQLGEIVYKTIATLVVSILLLQIIHANINQKGFVAGAPELFFQQQPRQFMDQSFRRLLSDLKARDTCQTFFTSKLHGYEVQEHIIKTNDNYKLALHRIIHPSDMKTNGPAPGTKKPYLLLHGLIGSSASFVRHIDPNYKAPERVFDPTDAIEAILKQKSAEYQFSWQSTSDHWHTAFDGDTSRTLEDLKAKEKLLNRGDKMRKPYASLNELDFDADAISFARDYKQAYRKFQLPKDSKSHITNSLAFTLSNFGYDVWLLNLRGNQYSRDFEGPTNHLRDDYWDFNIEKLINEDLMASISHVRQIARSDKFGPVGFVSYSYSNIHLLGLLSKYPAYQKHLQPVIMMAPTMFSSTGGKTRYLMKLSSKFISHNGPFPALARGSHDKFTRLICSLPLASKLCRLLETVLYGQAKSVRSLVFDDKKSSMVKKDVDCGQTSTAVLHQILHNLSQQSITPDFKPFIQARNRLMAGEKVRRSVILIHADSDDISSHEEVKKIRDSALELMTLVDYNIKEQNFGHTDFLFSKRNQYLVNGEIARMATLYDNLMYQPSSNQLVVGRRY